MRHKSVQDSIIYLKLWNLIEIKLILMRGQCHQHKAIDSHISIHFLMILLWLTTTEAIYYAKIQQMWFLFLAIVFNIDIFLECSKVNGFG